jgi:hypothetical protein
MSPCKLRTPWPIHFKLRIVIGIDSLMVCILLGEISIFHSRVMGLYSSNCRWFFVCQAVNWEPLGQFTSNFTQLLELIVLRSVYLLVKFRIFIQELWEKMSLQILYECWLRAYHALLAQLFICCCFASADTMFFHNNLGFYFTNISEIVTQWSLSQNFFSDFGDFSSTCFQTRGLKVPVLNVLWLHLGTTRWQHFISTEIDKFTF